MSRESKREVNVKKAIYIETIIMFVIALTPILHKLYDYFPGPNSQNAHETISFLFFEIGSNGFDSISTNLWFYSQKVIPLILCLFWFFTSKNWWYHIIMIPIATYAFQIFELLFSEDTVIDTENIWWLLPICMVVIPFVYFIRIKLYDKYVNGIDLEAMEAELHTLKKKRSQIEIKKKRDLEAQSPDTIEYRSLSEWIDQKLSTGNLELIFRQFQSNLKNWMHLKF